CSGVGLRDRAPHGRRRWLERQGKRRDRAVVQSGSSGCSIRAGSVIVWSSSSFINKVEGSTQSSSRTREESMGGVLEGVRVLDFGRYIAGPYCATLLAEFGAEVIRVEKRDGSEDRFVAPVGAGGEGALFLQVNRNKKCI